MAAQELLAGGLVVMPTETVYGLACLALHRPAIESVFRAKGRPSENPLIVHVASPGQAGEVARVSDAARLLMDRLWPGPLTLVLPKLAAVPSEVTAGLETVGVRMPSHPIALALIERTGPLAAPSANRFMRLSPTRPEDVDPTLGDWIVLDGGTCAIGIESTVVDLAGPPRILRLGHIGRGPIEHALGVTLAEALEGESGPHSAPGQYRRHYAPATKVRLTDRLEPDQAGLTFDPPMNPNQLQMSREPEVYAARLYLSLAQLDRKGLDQIGIERPPETPEWSAVRDRLMRAAET